MGSFRSAVRADSHNLDVLRAAAVLLVFCAHALLQVIDVHLVPVANYGVWNLALNEVGRVGVLFFFVHTALVLTLSLERTQSRAPALNFYIRRIFRIYPLSVATILVVLVFKIPQTPAEAYSPWAWSEILANMLLVQNLTHMQNIIQPLWTLPREMQMYLVLPLIYWAVRKFRSGAFVLALWLALVVLTPKAPMLLGALPSFLGGVFAYQLSRERVFRLPALLWPAAIVILFAAHAALYFTILPDYRADFVFCMFLGILIPNILDMEKSWLTLACQTVAKYSYAIYLCHDPILWLVFIKLAWMPLAARLLVLAAMMVAVPYIAYRFLEAPMIDAGRKLARLLDEPPAAAPVSAEAA
jgi:peptidoglycan/LPS O-acetylase OafA/YrhL